MTYNVFDETLSLTQSINHDRIKKSSTNIENVDSALHDTGNDYIYHYHRRTSSSPVTKRPQVELDFDGHVTL